MMLSPSILTETGTGGLPGKLKVQVDGSPVALKTIVRSALSEPMRATRTFHLPATSAAVMLAGAGAAMGACPAGSAAGFPAVSAGGFSALAQPITVMVHNARNWVARRMKPPGM